jgi:hypothetical protein
MATHRSYRLVTVAAGKDVISPTPVAIENHSSDERFDDITEEHCSNGSQESDPIARCFVVVDISFKDCGVSFTSCSFERPPASITDRIIGASSLPLLFQC